MKKGLVIAAVVLIALGILVFAGGFIASGFNFAKLDVAKYETNTYNVDGAFNGIEVNTIEADVTLKPSEDGQFRAVCVERNGKIFEVRVDNGTLKVNEPKRDNWPMRMFSFKSPSVTLYLPQEHYEALSVKTVTGDVIAKNVNVEGIVSVTVTTGDIKFSGVTCKSFKTSGNTGDVELIDTVATDSFDIQRSTGDVVFGNSDAGEITVKTTTGDVSGTLRTDKIFTVKSTTGDVKVPDSASDGKCEICTTTGDISISVRH